MKPALLSMLAVFSLWAQGGGDGRAGSAPAGAFPKIVQKVTPEYTTEALEAKLEGSVYLSSVIGIDGIPSDIKVIGSLDKGLDEKAIECFKKWRFTPAMRNGEPITMTSQVVIEFKLPPASK